MNPPKITVLMPVWNAETFLPAALESIWKQTRTDFELLVVDDGSTDRTPEILASCCDLRLRVLRNEARQKLSGALNRGLGEARGELIARMDADDVMRSDRLARQEMYMARHSEIGCCGGWVRPFGDGPKKILKFPAEAEDIKAFSLFYTPFAHPSVMFRRERFAREGLTYDGTFYPAEDLELWSRAILKFPCGNLQRVLVDYRVHKKSMTGGEWSDMDAQTMRIHRRMLSQLNMDISEEELLLHRKSSMGLMPPSVESFRRTESWLLKLEAASHRSGFSGGKALADVLHFVWFRQAMASVRGMGWGAWKLYRQSRLSSYGDHAQSRRWTVWAASVKAGFVGKRP